MKTRHLNLLTKPLAAKNEGNPQGKGERDGISKGRHESQNNSQIQTLVRRHMFQNERVDLRQATHQFDFTSFLTHGYQLAHHG